jgi:hypothetical protein
MLSLVFDHPGDSDFYRSILERVPQENFVNVLNHIIPRQGGRAGPLASELVAKLLDAFPYRTVFPCLYSVKSDKRLIDETPTDQRKRYRIERAKIHDVVQQCRHTKIVLEARKVIRGVNQLTLPLSQYCLLATNLMLLQIGPETVPRKLIRARCPRSAIEWSG